jgi:von Willebrand factor type A domain
VTLLSPAGLLVAPAVLLPLAALALALRRVERVRTALRLEPPPMGTGHRAWAVAAVPALLALATAQPALTTKDTREIRTDAEAFVIVDVSRSMLAASTPTAATRLSRAKDAVLRIREALGEVPTGLASLTDRVLPLLFPTADRSAFEQTVRRALAPESPPPREVSVTATMLGALGEAARGNLFSLSARQRLFVVVTDGESRPFDETAVARALDSSGVGLVVVHAWQADERVYRAEGGPERAYRPDPHSRAVLMQLAAAAGGEVFPENDIGAAERAAAREFGDGPTRSEGSEERVTPLAPYVALAALVPLAVALRRRGGF